MFVLNVGVLLLVSILWREKDIKFTWFIFAGSCIYRDLSKYIRKERKWTYLAISYSGVILFVLASISMIVSGFSK